MARRVVAEEEADGDSDGERQHERPRCDDRLPAGERADQPRRHDSDDQARDSTGGAQHDRLDQELGLHRPGIGSNRLADPDLPRPLAHRHEHHVHDPDPADEQGDPAECEREQAEGPARFLRLLHGLRLILDREVVGVGGRQVVISPEEHRDRVHRRRDLRRVEDADAGALRRRAADQDTKDDGEGDIDAVVEVLAAQLPFARLHADHLELVAADPDGLTDRVPAGEELRGRNGAEHDDAAAEVNVTD